MFLGELVELRYVGDENTRLERNRRRSRRPLRQEQRVPKEHEKVLQIGHAHANDDAGLFDFVLSVVLSTDVQRFPDATRILRAVHVHKR